MEGDAVHLLKVVSINIAVAIVMYEQDQLVR